MSDNSAEGVTSPATTLRKLSEAGARRRRREKILANVSSRMEMTVGGEKDAKEQKEGMNGGTPQVDGDNIEERMDHDGVAEEEGSRLRRSVNSSSRSAERQTYVDIKPGQHYSWSSVPGKENGKQRCPSPVEAKEEESRRIVYSSSATRRTYTITTADINPGHHYSWSSYGPDSSCSSVHDNSSCSFESENDYQCEPSPDETEDAFNLKPDGIQIHVHPQQLPSSTCRMLIFILGMSLAIFNAKFFFATFLLWEVVVFVINGLPNDNISIILWRKIVLFTTMHFDLNEEHLWWLKIILQVSNYLLTDFCILMVSFLTFRILLEAMIFQVHQLGVI